LAGWRKVTIHNFKRKSRTGEMDKCDAVSIFKDILAKVTPPRSPSVGPDGAAVSRHRYL
jgi:hypothetical protein